MGTVYFFRAGASAADGAWPSSEDYHIRALLLRSGLVNRNWRPKEPLRVTVVSRSKNEDLETRYKGLLRFADVEFHSDGFEQWLSDTR
jgi:hypothetical protein